jgi:hypothetical protein
VSRTNCYCGNVRDANCTSCGEGVCLEHKNKVEYACPDQLEVRRSFGYGANLSEAAYHKGYWTVSKEIFQCASCRHKAGEATRARILRQSKAWPSHSDPFNRAVVTIAHGLVHKDLEMPYGRIIDRWLKLGLPTEAFQTPYLIRKMRLQRRTPFGTRPHRPAKMGASTHHGWTFPGTVSVEVDGIMQMLGTSSWQWIGVTHLRVDGALWQSGQEWASIPYEGDALHMLTAMSQKLVAHRGLSWQGPETSWK